MEALQVRQRSSDFDRISNRLSILEWKEHVTETSLVSGRQGGRREWVAEVGKPGRRLLQLPVSCNRAWLVEWTEVTPGGKTEEQ